MRLLCSMLDAAEALFTHGKARAANNRPHFYDRANRYKRTDKYGRTDPQLKARSIDGHTFLRSSLVPSPHQAKTGLPPRQAKSVPAGDPGLLGAPSPTPARENRACRGPGRIRSRGLAQEGAEKGDSRVARNSLYERS